MNDWSHGKALELLKKHLFSANLIKHSIAVEAGMAAFARLQNADTERYALAGLLHDLDYESTKDNFARHGFVSREILRKEGFADEDILTAIVEHSGNVKPQTPMGKALYAVDPATGFLTACALMRPDKKLASVESDFYLKRFAEKRFAQGANREQMKTVESHFGITVSDFLAVVLSGMREKSEELGL